MNVNIAFMSLTKQILQRQFNGNYNNKFSVEKEKINDNDVINIDDGNHTKCFCQLL